MVATIRRSTSNYSLIIPNFDVPGWGSLLERNFDIMDAILYATTGLAQLTGVWLNNVSYEQGQRVVDPATSTVWQCAVEHVSSPIGVMVDDRSSNPTYWDQLAPGFVVTGEWATGHQYYAGDIAFQTSEHLVALCAVDHISTSGMRADSTNWSYIADFGTVEATVAASAASAASSAAAAAASAADSVKEWKGPWVTAHAYVLNDAVSQNGSSYICVTAHTSGTFATDLSAVKWQLFAQKGDTGVGAGDMTKTTYDPTNIAADVFSMANMVETSTKKVFTATERAALADALADILDIQTNGSAPTGSIIALAHTTVPASYLECAGAVVSRTTYVTLFNLVGTTYGAGNGTTTFNLPDLRGEFLRGWDHGRGIDSARGIGSAQVSQMGSHTHTVTVDASGAHTHAASASTDGVHNHSNGVYQNLLKYDGNGTVQQYDSSVNEPNTQTFGTMLNAGAHTHAITVASVGTHTHTGTATSTGGTTNSSETRPRNVAVMYAIKT